MSAPMAPPALQTRTSHPGSESASASTWGRSVTSSSATRELPPATRDATRRKIEALPHAERLLAVLEGEEEDDQTLGRIFGEELPSGLVLAEEVSG